MPRAIAVDWSGRRDGGRGRIWIAEAVDGRLERLDGDVDRDGAIAWLRARRTAVEEAVVGLDFAFSLPAWFLDERACADADALWTLVADEGEGWLEACPPPFWGRPGRRRGDERQWRACEEALLGGPIRPKGVFQIGGAGAVGTGSLRGMPHLPRLREAGWSIWPFDRPGRHVVAEIWPRLLTGPAVKSTHEGRDARLADEPGLDAGLRARALGSEDAFDAALSALALSRSTRLAEALAAPPPGDPREGAILAPGDVRAD